MVLEAFEEEKREKLYTRINKAYKKAKKKGKGEKNSISSK